MSSEEHVAVVRAEARSLNERLLRLAIATAYTHEYVAELLDGADDDAASGSPEAERARDIAEVCRRLLINMRIVSPETDGPRSPVLDMRRLSALAFDKAPGPMTISRLDSDVGLMDARRPRALMVNQAFADLLGYSVEQIVSAEDDERFTYGGDRACDMEHVRRLLAGSDTGRQWFKRYVHADGHLVWARIAASLMRDPREADAIYLIAQVREVNEHTAEEARSA